MLQDFNDSDSVDSDVVELEKSDAKNDIERGRHTQQLLDVWERLLESRLQLQHVLIVANQLPHPENWKQFMQCTDESFQETLTECQRGLLKLLSNLVQLQTELLSAEPATAQLLNPAANRSRPATGEVQISDEDSQAEDRMDSSSTVTVPRKRLSLAEYPGLLAKRHKTLQSYQTDILEQWSRKTQTFSSKLNQGFKAFDQSVVKQISQILSDKSRLLTRTKVKRSVYRVLGTKRHEPEVTVDDDAAENELACRQHIKETDDEIFDDDDFYHQLLRELILEKSRDCDNPVMLSRQWLLIQKLRSRSKKSVETKASKGRKIRYNVHPKLVNFMAKTDTCQLTDDVRLELCKSLFGRIKTAATQETNTSEPTTALP